MVVVALSAPAEPRGVIVSASKPTCGFVGGLKPNAFPLDARLRSAAEYDAVFKGRMVLKGRWFNVHVLPRNVAEEARLGLIVAKKLLRTAVARNLTKRLVREAFRCRRRALPAADFVFRLKARPGPGSTRVDRKLLRPEIDHLLADCVRRFASVALKVGVDGQNPTRT